MTATTAGGKKGCGWNKDEFHRSWSGKPFLCGQTDGFLHLYLEANSWVLLTSQAFCHHELQERSKMPFHIYKVCLWGVISVIKTAEIGVWIAFVMKDLYIALQQYWFFSLSFCILTIFCFCPIGKAQNFRPGNGFEDEHTEQQQSKHAERGSTYE